MLVLYAISQSHNQFQHVTIAVLLKKCISFHIVEIWDTNIHMVVFSQMS